MLNEYREQIKELEYDKRELEKFVRLLKECIENDDFTKIVEENERLRKLIKKDTPENYRDDFNMACHE